MSFETLRALADRAALFTALRQDQLASALDSLGEHRWDADLAAGTFTFAADDDPARTLEAVPHLLVSIAPGPRSLMWSWALPQGDRSGVTDALRAYGEQHGIPELTRGEVPFPDGIGDDVDAWIADVAHVIGGAAVEIIGRSPYYSAPFGGGSRAVLLLDVPLPPLTVAAAVAALPRVMDGLELNDPRSSVWDLARLAGWQLEWADDAFSAAEVTDATGSATFHFDEYARISGIRGRLAATP
ncbi:hypothetical protein CW368_05345 [Actinomycetales bacterium SN12]|nr:hypothetical protein CW368_05345 [Actinomycetales bacterium SN12]